MAAQLDPIFTDNINALADSSKTLGTAASGGNARTWQTPPQAGWSGNHADIAGMVAPFKRDKLNNAYAEAVSNGDKPGSVGDLVSLVSQIAYVGAMERAYRARHASPVRCIMNAAGKRKGHGHPAGILKGGVVRYVQSAIAAGQAS